MKKLLFFSLFSSLFLVTCTEDDLPNPYDDVDYNDTPLMIDTVSPYSFVKIHRDILFPSCSSLGCHDGRFEPDFRTVESAYNTLVYYPINKNNASGEFKFRVVPGDTALSVLHERLTNCCFVDQDDRMPQVQGGAPLLQDDIDKISVWIMEGAKDISGGNVAEPSNTLPWVKHCVVANDSYDTLYGKCGDGGFPFSLPQNEQVHFMFRVDDDSTAAADMLINQLSLSENSNDFSNPIFSDEATYFKKWRWGSPLGESAEAPGTQSLTDSFNIKGAYWIVSLNTATVLQSGTRYFMRYTIDDGDNPSVDSPNNESATAEKENWSFTID